MSVSLPSAPRASLVASLLVLLAGLSPGQITVVLRDMDGTRGLVGQGEGGFTGPPFVPVAGALGRSCAVLDANGDGYDDLLVGAPTLPTNPSSGVEDEAGHAYLLFGSAARGQPGASPDLSLRDLVSGEGIDLLGDPGDRAGTSVAAAGDVNGDGIDDFLVGAPFRTLGGRTDAGGAYVVFGASDLDTLPAHVFLSALAAGGSRATFLQGARAGGTAGHAVSGDVDVDGDGRADPILGAPLDSTGGWLGNGTASVVYGAAIGPGPAVLDLAGLGAGSVTVVHGDSDFQLLGFSVAGIGRFDPVLPMTNQQTDPLLGDDVAIGAPGTSPGAAFFAGAVYVLRGDTSGSPAASYSAADFGNGPNTAGIVFDGAAAGDQAGLWVSRARDLLPDGSGHEDLLVTAPFNDGVGKAGSGSVYALAGQHQGVDPQGFDLSQIGPCCPTNAGVQLQGAFTGDGLQGVFAVTVGDWDGDGVEDLAVGFPDADYVDGQAIHLGAGRAQVLSGAVLAAGTGLVDLSLPPAGLKLATLVGEITGARVGSALAAGDVNGDGNSDLAVGAVEAPSDPNPLDPSGVGHTLTGRAHLVYGPLLRVASVSPGTSHFGGPAVTVTAHALSAVDGVLVDGVAATILQVTPGDPGTVSFDPPAPVSFGALAEVTLQVGSLDVPVSGALQYATLAVTSGPTPDVGFGGRQTSLVGTAFSTLADTQVLVGGVAASLDAVDGLAGTLGITLPFGPPVETPLDLRLINSNGDLTLSGAYTYQPIAVDLVAPAQGAQSSGVFNPNAPGGTFAGVPAVPVDVTVGLAQPPLTTNVVIEFGSDVLGWRTATVTGVNGEVASLELPPFLLGPQDTLVDLRVTHGGFTVTQPDLFTYLAGDYTEHAEHSKPGGTGSPPRALMAGPFSEGAQILFLMDGWATDASLIALFLGVQLADVPAQIHGGSFPIDPSTGFFSFLFLPPIPQQSSFLPIPANMPGSIDPAVDGLSLWAHVLTRDGQGASAEWGFSNLLEMTFNLTD